MKMIGKFICLSSLVMLIACSNGLDVSSENNMEKNNDIEVELADVVYVLTENDGTYMEEDNKQTIKITIDLTNHSDKSFKFHHDMNMHLTNENGEEVDLISYSAFPTGIDVSQFVISPIVKSEETKQFQALFQVEQKESYELSVELPSGKPIFIPIDFIDYEETVDQVKDPEKALQAYLDVIILGKENDELQNLMTVEPNEELTEAYEVFAEKMKNIIYYDVEDEELEELFTAYKLFVEEKSIAKASIIANSDHTAIVEVEYEALDHKLLLEEVLQMVETLEPMPEDAFVAEVMESFPTTFESMELKTSHEPLRVVLEKNGDKWSIPEAQMSKKERLLRVFFAGGVS